MLIGMRNAMVAGKRLPYDAEVEYLETDADAYINTGITPQNDIGFIVDFMCTELNRANHIIGASDGVARMELFVRTTNEATANMSVYFGGAADNANDGTAWYMRRATVAVNYLNSRITEVDNNYLSSLGSFSATIDSPLYLLGYNSNGAATVSRGLRVYQAKISFGASLVRDFIPVRKGTAGYLYDRVTGKLFGNAGTGDFVLGPDVVPVEYIESHGTEYIDTGIKANTTTTRLDIELMLTQSTVSMGLFGSRNSSGVYNHSSCNAFFLSNDKVFRMDWVSGGNLLFNCSQNTAYSISITGGSVTINGSTTTYGNRSSVDQANNFLIFSFAEGSGVVFQNGMIGRVFGAKIYSNNLPIRSFRPVRVGTGSTWEGAMMDVLTRRIYRNAGTGAFAYGNDLRYPIPAA